MVCHHLKSGQVTSGTAYCGHVSQSDAGLADAQRVCWRGHLAAGHVWLEVGNTGNGEVDVITPPSDNWVRLDAGVTAFLKESQEGFPHGVLEGFTPHREPVYGGVADEGVRVLGGIAARGAACVPRPEARAGDPAGLADVPGLLPVGYVDLSERHAAAPCRARCTGQAVLKAIVREAPAALKARAQQA